MSATLIVEGGSSEKSKNVDSAMRAGFRHLFDKLSPRINKPRILPGGPRNEAIKSFVREWRARQSGDIVLLLIDSEEPIEIGESKIELLKRRKEWSRVPGEITESDLFLMVTAMESWICSDTEALAKHFGNAIHQGKLPAITRLESLTPTEVFKALKSATADCRATYTKGAQSFQLIGLIDPAKLEQLPHAREFLDALRTRMGNT